MTTTSDQPSGIGFEGADGHADRHHLRNGHRPFHLDGEADPGDTHDFAALVEENAQLRARLDSLPIIEQSKGILMVRYQIDTDTAFALLRRWSSHNNIKNSATSAGSSSTLSTGLPDPTPPTAHPPSAPPSMKYSPGWTMATTAQSDPLTQQDATRLCR